MESPEPWSAVKPKNEAEGDGTDKLSGTPVASADSLEMDAHLQALCAKTEPILDVESQDTSVKLEPRESEADNQPVLNTFHKHGEKIEQTYQGQTDIKTESTENSSAEPHKDNWNDDYWDDIPIFYGDQKETLLTGLMNVSEEEKQKQRRKKRAEARRMSRARLKQESPQVYQEKLKAEAEAKRKLRRESRQQNNGSEKDMGWSVQVKKKRTDETTEEREARLQAQAEAARVRRQKETPEQRTARNRANVEARRRRQMKETLEQRQERLFFQAMKQRQVRQNRTLLINKLTAGLIEETAKDSFSKENEICEKYTGSELNSYAQTEGLTQENRSANLEAEKTQHQSNTSEQQQAQLASLANGQKQVSKSKSVQSDGLVQTDDAASNGMKMNMTSMKAKAKRPVKPAKSYQCDTCDAAFDNSKSLTTHKYIHTGHCLPDRTFACRFCGVSFNDSIAYNDHLQINHREMCPFLCHICGTVFYHSVSLKVHLRRHSGQRPYICHVCSGCFTSSGSLRGHLRIHTGERPYACSVCQSTFRYNSALTSHMRSHTNERPYTCSDCEVTFKHHGKLMAHRQRKHLRGQLVTKSRRRSNALTM